MQAKNVKQVLIADYVGSAVPTVGAIASTLSIAAGQIAVVNSRNSNKIINITTPPRYVKVVYHSPSTGKLVFSDEIDGMNVTGYQGYIPQAEQEQIHYIGYNGSTGSIDVENLVQYLITIQCNGASGALFAQGDFKYGVYKSTASATQAAIAKGLVENLVANYSNFRTKDMKFELVSDGSITAFTGTAADHITVTNGSKIVTFQDAHGLTSGWIKLAGINYSIVSAPSTTTLELNIPYQGDSGYIINSGASSAITATIGSGTGITTSKNVTLSAAHGLTVGTPCWIYLAGTLYPAIVGGSTPTTDITLYQAVTDDAGVSIAGNGYFAATPPNWGIKLSGLPLEHKVGVFEYNKVTFSVSLSTTFGDTPSETTQFANWGRGNGKSVADDEYRTQGEEDGGYRSRPNIPAPTNYRTDADVTKYYSQLLISWNHSIDNGNGHTITQPKQLVIYAESTQNKYETFAATKIDACLTDDTSGVGDVLDVLIATTYSKGTAQTGNL